MKKWRNLVLFLLAFVMTASVFVGCGGGSSNKDQNPGIDTPGGDENDGDNNNNNNGDGKEKRNGNEQDFYLDYFRLTAV